MSAFPCLMYNSDVRVFTSVLFDTEVAPFQAFFCEVLVELQLTQLLINSGLLSFWSGSSNRSPDARKGS